MDFGCWVSKLKYVIYSPLERDRFWKICKSTQHFPQQSTLCVHLCIPTFNMMHPLSFTTANKWVRSMIHPSPVAIAIILGPLSSHPSDLMMEHLARLYCPNRSENHRSCSVILASSPPVRFMLNQNLQAVAQDVLHHTSNAILQHQKSHVGSSQAQAQLPIIIHSFSNGGAFLQEAIELELSSSVSHNHEMPSTSTKEHYERIRSGFKMGYQFFDSCPCYIRTIWDSEYLGQSFPHASLPIWMRYLYTVGSAMALTSWCVLTLAWYRPRQFWNRMLHSTVNTNHQIFMYTTTDMLTDAAAIDRFVQIRRHQYGVNCTVYRYNDSNHCQFYKDHPTEYQKAIDDALASVIVNHTSPPATSH